MTHPDILSGIIEVHGPHSVGKSTFSLEGGAEPSKILFLDGDVKGSATNRELGFGKYVDLVALASGKLESALGAAVIDLCSQIEEGEFDVIVLDNFEAVSRTFHTLVMENPNKYRKEWSAEGRMRYMQMWPVARELEAQFLNDLSRKARQVVVTHHMKTLYLGKVRVEGRETGAGGKTIQRVARMRLRLIHNPLGSPVPAALVVKNIDKKVMVDGRIRTVNILPRKVVPIEGERSLWDAIWRYWEDPIGSREPNELEKVTPYEMDLIEGVLSQEENDLLKMLISKGLTGAEEEESTEVTQSLIDQVVAMSGEKKPLPVIAKETGLSISEVRQIIASQGDVDFGIAQSA